MKWSLVIVLVIAITHFCTAAEPNFAMPSVPADDSQFGAKIQRTMSLLATSSPEKRNRVKVLFYGQSITVQEWTNYVADYLRETYPNADLTIENRAIGGFASQLLIRAAEYDLYPFYPDLMIFHVYGDHRRYEDIIRFTRERTTAEIAIYNDHSGAAQDKTPDFNDDDWTAFMDGHIRNVADKYGCELIDIHEPWKQYLRDNQLKAQDLLKDGIHLNDHGNFLLAEFVKRHLVYKPQFTCEPQDMVTTYDLDKDVSFSDGRLVLEFAGNRVDLISGRKDNSGATVRVLVDTRKPSEFPQAYAFTRPTYVHSIWPAVKRFSHRTPLIVENWMAKLYDARDFASQFSFDVYGSKTGYDGSGTSDANFISRSGRIVIDKDDWYVNQTCKFAKKELPEDFETKWSVVPMFTDTYRPERIEDPAKEYATTVIQGITNSSHTLELISDEPEPPIKAIRIYRPPFGRQ